MASSDNGSDFGMPTHGLTVKGESIYEGLRHSLRMDKRMINNTGLKLTELRSLIREDNPMGNGGCKTSLLSKLLLAELGLVHDPRAQDLLRSAVPLFRTTREDLNARLQQLGVSYPMEHKADMVAQLILYERFQDEMPGRECLLDFLQDFERLELTDVKPDGVPMGGEDEVLLDNM